MALDWTRAATRAQEIVANWQGAAGPGGAVVLFDRDGVREAFAGGLASIEYGVPFTPQTPNRFASISKPRQDRAAVLIAKNTWLALAFGYQRR